MYLAIAGACAEQKANAVDTTYTLSELSFDSVADAGTTALVELLISPTELILTLEPGTGEKLDAYAFDDSTLPNFTTVQNTLSVGSGSNPRGNCFGNSGQYLYVTGHGTPYLSRRTLTTPYDISSASSPTTGTNVFGTQGMAYKDDGSVAYLITSTDVRVLTLSSNWGVSGSSVTRTLGGTDDDGDTITSYTGIRFKPDGTKVFVSYRTNNTPKVAEYSLSTAWDLTTKTFTSSINIGSNIGLYTASQNAYIAGLDWNSDGSKLFVCSIHVDNATNQTKVGFYS